MARSMYPTIHPGDILPVIKPKEENKNYDNYGLVIGIGFAIFVVLIFLVIRYGNR